MMRDAIVTEYVELCAQIAALSAPDATAEIHLYSRLDALWYVLMTADERRAAEERLVVKARAWHADRRTEDP